MADLSGDRGGLIPAYNLANQLNPCNESVQVVPDAGWYRSSMGPVNMATNGRDTRSASETWMIMNSTMPVVQRKCTRCAFWKLPNTARSSENWIGFQIASPK